jgi:hypothetical protein
MARPTKKGVDYFPLDVYLNSKIKFVEIKYGLIGFAIIIKLLQKIYGSGYWCKFDEDEKVLFSDDIKADVNLVSNVLDEALNRKLFDKGLFEKYEILTSIGIQERYQTIVKRRKEVEIEKEYLLIEGEFGINVDTNRVNVSNNKQSKVKKSKQNKSKEKKDEEPTSSKHKCGKYKNVLLTEEEHLKILELENGSNAIEFLSDYIEMKGYKAKSHYLAIRKWVFNALKEQNLKEKELENKEERLKNKPLRNIKGKTEKQTPDWYGSYEKQLEEAKKKSEEENKELSEEEIETILEEAKEIFK